MQIHQESEAVVVPVENGVQPGTAPAQAAAPGFWGWIGEGLRAGVGRSPRTGLHQPTPGQMAGIVLLLVLFNGLIARLAIEGPAVLNLRGWVMPWWSAGPLLLLAWWMFSRMHPPQDESGVRLHGLASWFALSNLAVVPVVLLTGLSARLPGLVGLAASSVYLAWALLLLPIVLLAWVTWVLLGRYGVRGRWKATYLLGWMLLIVLTVWYFNDRPWWPDHSKTEAEEDARPRFELSQEAFEKQQAVWAEAVAALSPQRPGVIDVYGIVFAPNAQEDVFLREARMVTEVLAERFEARGRVLHLQNHATTQQTLPWATPLNMERAIQAVAQRMDREQDLLVIYLTSHGASNFKLAASFWPLEVESLDPKTLREMLDRAGVRHRVIAISACYSGGWIGPLADEQTLVMTAANAERTSYGCGRKSELTYFGRAVFDEQLRKTHSFEQAFAAARPIIDEREKQAGKKDGYSDPQISIGNGIRPVLLALEQRLGPRASEGATKLSP